MAGITFSDPVSTVLGGALQLGTALVDRIFPDPAAAAQAKLQLLTLYQSGELQTISSQAGIIEAEAKSDSWLTASWRPIMMLTFVAIIANNYILYPYLRLFFHAAPILDLPPDMWDLLKIGVGGYVTGRSIEKVAGSIPDMITAKKGS